MPVTIWLLPLSILCIAIQATTIPAGEPGRPLSINIWNTLLFIFSVDDAEDGANQRVRIIYPLWPVETGKMGIFSAPHKPEVDHPYLSKYIGVASKNGKSIKVFPAMK